jgi:hypothetical protein
VNRISRYENLNLNLRVILEGRSTVRPKRIPKSKSKTPGSDRRVRFKKKRACPRPPKCDANADPCQFLLAPGGVKTTTSETCSQYHCPLQYHFFCTVSSICPSYASVYTPPSRPSPIQIQKQRMPLLFGNPLDHPGDSALLSSCP